MKATYIPGFVQLESETEFEREWMNYQFPARLRRYGDGCVLVLIDPVELKQEADNGTA